MTKKEILDLVSKKKWIEASTPGYLLPCVGWMRGFMRSRKYFSHPLNELFLIIRDDGLATQIAEAGQVFEKVKELYDFPEKTKNIITDWRNSNNVFFEKWQKLNDSDFIKKLSNKELGRMVEDFIENQVEVWAAPLQADLLGVYSETELLEQFIGILPEYEKGQGQEIFAKISQPSKISFVSEERISILKLAILYKENSPDFEKLLSEHQSKYFWIKNTYRYLQILPVSYFLETVKNESKRSGQDMKNEIDEIKNVAIENKIRKEFFLNHKIPKNLEEKLDLTFLLGDWLDERKEFNLKSNNFVFVLATEIAKRIGLKTEEIYCLFPEEIKKILFGGIIDKKEIGQRIKWLVYVTTQPENEFIFSGDDAKEIIQAFNTEFSVKNEIETFKGVVASHGEKTIYKGRVRIVHDVIKDTFEDGEILVTSSTRPEFVPLMRKTLCIITDEGGIASHAAIVSRELKKPCIIGTKIATKVLKDGDLVEVDANTGLVKIIKRAM